MLSNPIYAGTYVFGRHQSRRIVDPGGTIRLKTVDLPREEWAVVLRNHHPAYLSWETYLANQGRLAQNYTAGGAHPVRTGEALLQGIVLCGTCGRGMGPVYRAGQPVYKCTRSALDGVHSPGFPAVPR